MFDDDPGIMSEAETSSTRSHMMLPFHHPHDPQHPPNHHHHRPNHDHHVQQVTFADERTSPSQMRFQWSERHQRPLKGLLVIIMIFMKMDAMMLKMTITIQLQ